MKEEMQLAFLSTARDLVEAFNCVSGSIDYATKRLGLEDAATPMGALELHAMEIKGLAEAISKLADAVSDLPNKDVY